MIFPLSLTSTTFHSLSDWETTSNVVCQEIAGLMRVNVVLMTERQGILTIAAVTPEGTELGAVNQAAAEWAWARGEPAGAGTETLNAADWQFHPLKTSMGVLAVVGLAREEGGEPVTADKAVLLSTLLGQAALAHERLRIEDQVRQVSVLEERDRLRAALLSSIGHDLRTPLTSVAGAIDELAKINPHNPAAGIAKMETARLRRFLDNLLDMVRIDAGSLQLTVAKWMMHPRITVKLDSHHPPGHYLSPTRQITVGSRSKYLSRVIG